MTEAPLTRWFSDLGRGEVAEVGGKNASLGEMIRSLKAEDARVPEGFATAAAYRAFIAANDLENRLRAELDRLKPDQSNLASVGKKVRKLIAGGEFSPELRQAIASSYAGMAERLGGEPSVAVRYSATAEDLPEASLAGQLESSLNIRGEDELLETCKLCFASLFTDRAIAYRINNNFDRMAVALERMVRSDLAGSGVMVSIDTETASRAPCSSTPPGASARPWCRAWSTRTSTTSSSRSFPSPASRPSSRRRPARRGGRWSMAARAASARASPTPRRKSAGASS